jgi:tRNA pseudouridine55 synthase
MRHQLNGVIVIDKPAGMSSARTVAKVKRLLGANKVGHAGTLDPFATGVLVCCINQATRLAQFFLHGRKRYQAVMHLGEETDTQDATGQVVAAAPVPELSTEQITAAVKAFQGPLMQQPPIYSALKHQGTPLYKLARQGRPVHKPPRPITVWAIDVTAVQLPDVHFEVTCSAGTYVRTLCTDIGQRLGCGGHLASLRRTASSDFVIEQALSLEALEAMDDQHVLNQRLIPMVMALQNMPLFRADTELLQRVAYGQPLTTVDLPATAIEQPDDSTLKAYVSVVDAQMELKAVLKHTPDDAAYDYCCVFN